MPSEAEWEFDWRAGTKTPYSFEDNITSLDVNYGVSKIAKPLVIAATSLMPLAYMICMVMYGNDVRIGMEIIQWER